jgi:hypothetical protein
MGIYTTPMIPKKQWVTHSQRFVPVKTNWNLPSTEKYPSKKRKRKGIYLALGSYNVDYAAHKQIPKITNTSVSL